ncbi:MAG: phosphate acyltransferase PlsX [Oscillospiraceae bacterium]
MKIVIDGFGGDNAPLDVLLGSEMAVKEYGIELVITGDEKKLKSLASEKNISLEHIEIVDAPTIIPVEEDPTFILKKYKDCSMSVGLHMLRNDEADGFVSAGSTGALIVGSATIVGRIKGIKRPAIATLIPTLVGKEGSYLLIDAGGNHECRPEMLAQFAIMGSAYMDKILARPNSTVGILNIGTEETKGLALQVNAYQILKKSPVNFIGNVEARGLPLEECDIVVTDGFTGNIALKLTEGMAISFSKALKGIFKKSPITMLGAVCVNGGIADIKEKMNTSKAGGAPILGLKKPVIKAHGNSNPEAFKNAIRQAKLCVEQNVVGEIEISLAKLAEVSPQNEEISE